MVAPEFLLYMSIMCDENTFLAKYRWVVSTSPYPVQEVNMSRSDSSGLVQYPPSCRHVKNYSWNMNGVEEKPFKRLLKVMSGKILVRKAKIV